MKALRVTGFLLGLLVLYDHHLALAASGGIMGGDSFRSFHSSSYRTSNVYYNIYRDRSSSNSSSPGPTKAPHEDEPISFFFIMIIIVIVFVCFFVMICYGDDPVAAKISIIKLQVGSLGTGRSLQRDLNRIAESADTSTSKGFNYVLQESIRSLLRHSDYYISGYSLVDVKRSVEECSKRFNQLSTEERGKFDEETLVNVNNFKRKSSNNEYIAVDVKDLEEYVKPFNQLTIGEGSKFDEETLVNVNIRKKCAATQSPNGLCNEYIVVTIIVAAHGALELPPIKSVTQLQKALQKLASIPSSNIMGARVLWTPQKEDDHFTEQEMLEDYPLLQPL